MNTKTRKLVVGIDLGTSTSCISCFDRTSSSAKVIGVGQNNANIMPSVVAYRKDAKTGAFETHPVVGDVANRQMVLNPEGTLFQTKRIIGRSKSEFASPSEKQWLESVPYKVEFAESGGPRITIPGRSTPITPIDVATRILQELVLNAKERMKSADQKIVVEDAVITVPAYFDNSHREATKEAGKAAGLNVLRILNEPTAAAIAYGIHKKKNCTTLVYDMGGGTFDVSIVDIDNGVFDVRTSSGDSHLGGADFDQRIIALVEKRIHESLGIQITDLTAKQRIRDAAETAKRNLSNVEVTTIDLPFIGHDGTGPKNFSYDLHRSELEEITSDLIDRANKLCEEALKKVNLTKSQINEVVLVGGMTRMKKISQWVKDYFGIEPCTQINPDEVVAMGAAIYASTLTKTDADAASASDEIVVLDVLPLSLGIETLGGIFTPIVNKDTTIPTSKSQVFSTAEDNQPQVEIKIYQGERKLTADNKFLGNFNLVGINPAPRGIPQIEVKFTVDENGILTVTAEDKASGKSQKLEVQASSQTSKEEAERMINEAKQYEQEDAKRRELAEQKNAVHGRTYEVTRLLKEVEGDLEKDESTKIHTDIAAVKVALAGDEIEKINTSIADLEKHLPRLRELKASKEKSDQTADANNPDDNNNPQDGDTQPEGANQQG